MNTKIVKTVNIEINGIRYYPCTTTYMPPPEKTVITKTIGLGADGKLYIEDCNYWHSYEEYVCKMHFNLEQMIKISEAFKNLLVWL